MYYIGRNNGTHRQEGKTDMIPNYDAEAKIHYGVISMHAVTQFWCDESEPYYPDDLTEEEMEDFEPYEYSIDTEEYKAQTCLDTDIMIIKSPYYTYAKECSLCVPNAGNLESIPNNETDGLKAYCFGHDCFDEQKAPYPVYSVATDELIPAKENVT